jgi:hypothetical protein
MRWKKLETKLRQEFVDLVKVVEIKILLVDSHTIKICLLSMRLQEISFVNFLHPNVQMFSLAIAKSSIELKKANLKPISVPILQQNVKGFWMELAKNNTDCQNNRIIFVSILHKNVLMFYVELVVSNIEQMKFQLKTMYVCFQHRNVKAFWMELVESNISKTTFTKTCASLLLLNALMSWEERAVSSIGLMKRSIFATIQPLSVTVYWMEPARSNTELKIK